MITAGERANEIASELAAVNSLFNEGESGEITLWLDRTITQEEIAQVARKVDGRAFHLQGIEFDYVENALAMRFQAGVFFLPLVALVLGGMGILILSWAVKKHGAELALPAGLAAAGLLSIITSGVFGIRAWPLAVLGVGLTTGGVYLGWKIVFPPEEPIFKPKQVGDILLGIEAL